MTFVVRGRADRILRHYDGGHRCAPERRRWRLRARQTCATSRSSALQRSRPAPRTSCRRRSAASPSSPATPKCATPQPTQRADIDLIVSQIDVCKDILRRLRDAATPAGRRARPATCRSHSSTMSANASNCCGRPSTSSFAIDAGAADPLHRGRIRRCVRRFSICSTTQPMRRRIRSNARRIAATDI